MISSSAVNSDASLLEDVFSNYKTGKDAINSNDVWTGKSKETTVEQMENFISEYSEPIASQMSEFSTACEKYTEWEEKKKKLAEVEKKIAAAEADPDSKADLTGLKLLKSSVESDVNSLAKEIRTSLSNVRGKKINANATNLTTSGDFTLGEFKNFYQTDYQESYGYGKTIAQAGCGPTSMAMVLTYLTGETHDPVEMANWSMNNGYRVEHHGTSSNFFPAVSSAYGVQCEQKAVTKNNIVNSLNDGKTIIVNVGPGHFTKTGHYIVLKGLSSDGRVEIADPASEERSSETWDISTITSEAKGMWTFDTDKTSGMEI